MKTRLQRDPYAAIMLLARNIAGEKKQLVAKTMAFLLDGLVDVTPEAEEERDHLLRVAARAIMQVSEADLLSVATEDEIREVLQRAEMILMGEKP